MAGIVVLAVYANKLHIPQEILLILSEQQVANVQPYKIIKIHLKTMHQTGMSFNLDQNHIYNHCIPMIFQTLSLSKHLAANVTWMKSI